MLRRSALAVLFSLVTTLSVHAQWQIQDSHSTASLRGVSNPGNGVAWASGTDGTVLRTEDGGYMWQSCAMPPGAEKLDFRGIQAFDANTAIVMSSGKGDLSRIYKTTDGCSSWKLVYTNPDRDGFWDALQFDGRRYGIVLGDPVDGAFASFITIDGGNSWKRQKAEGLEADPRREGLFAASNSSLSISTLLAHRFFVTGGMGGPLFVQCHGELEAGGTPWKVECLQNNRPLPLASSAEAAGAFSLARDTAGNFVAVGGDYSKPSEAAGTAALSTDSGEEWHAAQKPPHGYRSAVAYDKPSKTWITVGPNGTDISRDDGRTWTPLKPAKNDPPDADKNWNALALPYVVGPKGRIGKLNPSALKH